MRDATNQTGYNVEYLSEDGWKPAQSVPGTNKPFTNPTKTDANEAMRVLRDMLPAYEFRVYPAVKGKKEA